MDQPRFSIRIPDAPAASATSTGTAPRRLAPPAPAAAARALVTAFGPTEGARYAAQLKADQRPYSADACYFDEVARIIEQQLYARVAA